MINDLTLIREKKIAIYGWGAVGHYVFGVLQKEFPNIEIALIIDDSKRESINNIQVVSLTEALKRQNEYEKIFITSSYYKKIEENLLKNSIVNYEVIDIFSSKGSSDIHFVEKGDLKLAIYTPNLFCQLLAERFFLIEPETIGWIEKFEGNSIFYDIGASNGMFALYAEKCANSIVVAFEPDFQNFQLLHKNLRLNNSFNTIPLNIAVSAECGTVNIISEETYEGAHGKKILEKQKETTLTIKNNNKVLSLSIDEGIKIFNLPPPDHIKIDVDGAEVQVLSGMKDLLINPKLKSILIEVQDDNLSHIQNIMNNYGYNLVEKHTIAEVIGGKIDGVANYLYLKK